jgi:hypothetical protein
MLKRIVEILGRAAREIEQLSPRKTDTPAG